MLTALEELLLIFQLDIGEAAPIRLISFDVCQLWLVCKLGIFILFRGGPNSECALGYGGILCDTCIGDFEGEHYARSGSHECNACESTSFLYFKLLLLIIFLCLYLAVMMKYLFFHFIILGSLLVMLLAISSIPCYCVL